MKWASGFDLHFTTWIVLSHRPRRFLEVPPFAIGALPYPSYGCLPISIEMAGSLSIPCTPASPNLAPCFYQTKGIVVFLRNGQTAPSIAGFGCPFDLGHESRAQASE